MLACKGNYECCSQIVAAVQLFGVQNILSDEDSIINNKYDVNFMIYGYKSYCIFFHVQKHKNENME